MFHQFLAQNIDIILIFVSLVLFSYGDRTKFKIILNKLILHNPYHALIRKSMYFRSMKKVISIIVTIIAYTHFCFAQAQASPFNTIGNIGYSKQKKKNSPMSNLDSTEGKLSLDSISKCSDIPSSKGMDIPQDKLSSIIEMYERYLSQKKKKDSCYVNECKIISYYKGSPRELNLTNLMAVSDEVGLSNQLFVMAQALLETGHFSSRFCKEYNNLFGLYDSKNRDYFRFARWEDSVVGYKKMIQYKYKGGNYLNFLKRIGYAEDPRYITKIAKMAKSIYQRLFKE